MSEKLKTTNLESSENIEDEKVQNETEHTSETIGAQNQTRGEALLGIADQDEDHEIKDFDAKEKILLDYAQKLTPSLDFLKASYNYSDTDIKNDKKYVVKAKKKFEEDLNKKSEKEKTEIELQQKLAKIMEVLVKTAIEKDELFAYPQDLFGIYLLHTTEYDDIANGTDLALTFCKKLENGEIQYLPVALDITIGTSEQTLDKKLFRGDVKRRENGEYYYSNSIGRTHIKYGEEIRVDTNSEGFITQKKELSLVPRFTIAFNSNEVMSLVEGAEIEKSQGDRYEILTNIGDNINCFNVPLQMLEQSEFYWDQANLEEAELTDALKMAKTEEEKAKIEEERKNLKSFKEQLASLRAMLEEITRLNYTHLRRSGLAPEKTTTLKQPYAGITQDEAREAMNNIYAANPLRKGSASASNLLISRIKQYEGYAEYDFNGEEDLIEREFNEFFKAKRQSGEITTISEKSNKYSTLDPTFAIITNTEIDALRKVRRYKREAHKNHLKEQRNQGFAQFRGSLTEAQ